MRCTTSRVAASLTALTALIALGALFSNNTDLAGRAAGAPSDNPDATFSLITPGGGASIAYRGGATGACQSMAAYGLTERAHTLNFEGPGVGTAILRLYEGPDCTGKSRDFQAAGDAVDDFDIASEPTIGIHGNPTSVWTGGMQPLSYRVVVTEPHAIDGDYICAGRGETVIDNGFVGMGIDAEGRLGLFRRDAETGALDLMGDSPDFYVNAGTAWDEVCTYRYGLRATGLLHDISNTVWEQTSDLYHSHVELTADCRLVLVPTNGGEPRVIVDGHCFDNMKVDVPEVAPTMEILFADIDDDNSPEMILDVRNPNGSGYFLTDPMGIASVLHTAGEDIDAEFYMALSATQKDGVRQQTLAVTRAGGAAGINALLTAVRANPEDVKGSFVAFPYTSSFETDDALYGAEGQLGDANASFHFNRTRYHLETDENGVSARMEMTLAEVEISDADGYATLSVKAGTQMGEFTVVEDGFVIGGSADAIAVSFTGGRQDRSHITIGASYGEGALVAASWGRSGLYGFSLQVPGVPVSIGIYVHRDEAIAAHDNAVEWGQKWGRWNRQAAHDTGVFFNRVVTEVGRDIAEARAHTTLVVRSAATESAVYIRRTGTQVVVAVESAAGQVQSTIEGSAEQVRVVLTETVDDIGDAITAAAGDAAQFAASIGGAVETGLNDAVQAVNQAANGAQSAASAVVNFFSGLF